MALIDREEQCPERRPGLSHIQDGEVECVFCGTRVSNMKKNVADGEPIETRAQKKAKREAMEVEFTDYEVNHLEFLKWLRRTGRVSS